MSEQIKEKIIEIRSLSYTYDTGTKALQNVDLDIYRGESVGIVGPNGAGKSTLLLHLNGFYRGNNTVAVTGLPITKENLAKIRSNVGIIFQDADNQLFMLTVYDDVAFGPINMGLSDEEVERRVKKALEAVNLSGYEKRAPYHLSGGEKRAAAIATVLSMEPNILVMDEPSSNLDPRTRRSLIRLLNSFDITKIIATHDLEMILELCTRCILLDEGMIITDGPTKEILSQKELLERHGLEKPISLLLKS